jgi:hypothetical protein
MALKDAAAEARKNFEELQKLAQKLRKDLSEFNLGDTVKDAETVKELLKGWDKEFQDSIASLDSIGASFQQTVSEISKGNVGLNQTKKSFNKLTSLASDLTNHTRGYNKLSVKQLESITSQAEQERKRLKTTLHTLKAEKDYLTQQGASQSKLDQINASISEAEAIVENKNEKSNAAYRDLLTNAQALAEKQGKVNDAMGLGGVALEGMVSAMDKMGMGGLSEKLGLDEAKKKMEEMAEEHINNLEKEKSLTEQIAQQKGNLSDAQIRSGSGGENLKNMLSQKDALSSSNASMSGMNGKMKILGEGAKTVGNNFSKASGRMAIAAFIIEQLIEALKAADAATGELAKGMNMTYDEALNTRRELGNMAANSGNAALSTKKLQENMMAVSKAIGSNVMLNEKDLITMTKLTSQAGFTADELMGVQKLSLVNGKSLEDNTKEILGGAKAYASRNKMVVNEKDVLREVNKASASLKLSLGGSAEAVAIAVVKAKQFGLTLEQAEKISSNLLQFESSIESELNAELLTGKELNFERARSLALEGKTAEAAAEVAKQVGTSKDFAKMNVIQQEALAKAAGMERDELAQSLMDKEAMAKMNGVEGANAKEKFDNLVKEVGMEEAKKRLGDEALANQFQQQSVQERFNEAIEKLKEIFIQIAEPILAIVSPLMELVTSVLPVINMLLQPMVSTFQLIGSTVQGIVKLLKGDFKGSLTSFKEVGKAFSKSSLLVNAVTANDLISPPQIPSSVVSIPYKISYMNDGASLPSSKSGYGSRTLFSPEGAIQLNNKDTVVAGTDLFNKGDDVISPLPNELSKPQEMKSSTNNITNNYTQNQNQEKEKLTVANSTSPKKEATPDPNASTNSRLDSLIKATTKVNSVSTLRIQ